MMFHYGIIRMRKIMLKSLFIILVLAAAATSCTGAPEFELVGRELFEGPPRDARVIQWGPGGSGKMGVILLGGGGVMIIPARDEEIMIPLDGIPLDAGIVGTNAWVAVSGIGLVGIDLSDHSAPKTWTAIEMEDIRSMVSLGRLIAVSSDTSGLHLFDAKMLPFSGTPRLLSRLEDTAQGARLTSTGLSIAAVKGREVVLMRIPEHDHRLEMTSSITAPAEITRAVESVWETLHILTRDGEVLRYDVTDPHHPEQISSLPEKNVSDIYLRRKGGLALLESGKIIPFHLPGSQEKMGGPVAQDPQYSLMREEGMTRSPSFPGSSIRHIKGGFITFGLGAGFNFYDYDRGVAKARGKVPANGFAIELTVRGEYVYLANGRDGMRIGHVGSDGSVEWTGHVPTDEARDVAIEGDILVLANGKSGVNFYSIAVPDSPVLLSTLKSSSYLSAVKVRSGIAYLAGGFHGILSVDFTDPAKPRLAWGEDLSEVRGLDLDEDYLYVADGFDGFRIYSLDGEVPRLVSTLETPGWASDLYIAGDLLHIADGQRGFITADVSDRSAPVKLGRIATGAIARTIHVRGKTAFIANQALGITAIDISDPEKPVIAARYQTVDDARGVYSDDRFVYLASGSGGLYIFRYKK